MAKAITQITRRPSNAEDQLDQAKQEILEAAAKHKESILMLLDVLNDFKEAGLLEIAHALISNRHQIGIIGLGQLNKSGAQNLIKNGMGAVELLTKLDPDTLGVLLGAVESGANAAVRTTGKAEKVGIFGMLRAMGNSDMKAALGFLMSFLRGFGRHLQRSSP